jgi:hypothetical protein
VEKWLGNIESTLKNRFPLEIQEFDEAVYQICLTLGRKKLISYYRNDYTARDKKSKRRLRKAWSSYIDNYFCPSYEDWWVQREESDLSEWEAEFTANRDDNGFKKWLMRNETLSRFVGFAD